MIPAAFSPLANHLWQSTVFAGLAALLALALRQNRAQTRYCLWLAASLKFLIPFSLLISLGTQVEWRPAGPVTPPALTSAIEQISQPFAASPTPVTPAPVASAWLPALLFAVWAGGCVMILTRWFVRWRRIRTALRNASPLPMRAPIAVFSSSTRLEPGIFGVLRPVLLLPEGIMDRLTPAQLSAILAHELCHVRRRDNLWSAIHMVVEATFWFHPLVWWIGARLVEERERACDEEVLLQGNEPEAYAAGILQVCRLYLESPLVCASGVTGSDLKQRVAAIMTNRTLTGMSGAKRLLLAAAGIAAVAWGPVVVGVVNAPRVRAQSPASAAQLKFEVASIKPADPNSRSIGYNRTAGNGLKAQNVTLRMLVALAYDVPEFQISGGPGWIGSERYDVLAKPDHPEGPDSLNDVPVAQQNSLFAQLRERTRTLLAERFQLAIHKEQKDVRRFSLVVAKNGHKLRPWSEGDHQTGIHYDRGEMTASGASMDILTRFLSSLIGSPVVDETGVSGRFSFKMNWTSDPDKVPAGDKTGGVASDPSEFLAAMQEQLGLRVESKKGPVDIIVIDRAEKPTAN